LVLLEAGACGAPVISSLDSPAEEIVAHGETGLLVAPGDVTALETAMLRVLSSTDECVRLGEGGRAHAATMTWERSTAQLIDVYEQTLGRPIRRGS
ncbi:MAG: glycosyltransferase, partial [Chloroflexi bacterium]|nr:glycosyltransferase [Chloroflexota bacterium]